MKSWARSSLRTKIFLAVGALILAVLIAALGLTQFVLSRDARRTVDQNLVNTGQVLDQLMSDRAVRLKTSAALLASDFALKRVIATSYDPANYEPGTLGSAAFNYQQRIGVELLWIIGDSGALLAASPSGVAIGRSAADFSPVREALKTADSATAIAELDGQLFQLVAVPVLGPDVIGYLVLGQVIDDTFARKLKQGTGSDVAFLTATRVFASTLPPAARDALLRQEIATATALVSADGKRFLARAIAVPAKLSQPLSVMVLGSYDAALAPLRSLQWRIAAIGAVALALALLAGIALAGGITAPVQSLVAGMREVINGNLKFRSAIARDDEIGFLATSFNDMVSGLEEREHVKDTFGRFVSRDVAAAVLGGHVPLEGERRQVSILFQDIRGFTAISEHARCESRDQPKARAAGCARAGRRLPKAPR